MSSKNMEALLTTPENVSLTRQKKDDVFPGPLKKSAPAPSFVKPSRSHMEKEAKKLIVAGIEPAILCDLDIFFRRNCKADAITTKPHDLIG